MNQIKRIAFAAALAASTTLAGHAAQAEEPKKGGTLTLLTSQVPRHFNPAVQSGTATGRPGTQIFATLLRYDEGWNPQPYLAESWSWSDDKLSMTVKLRAGAKFHDGEAITSEDVKFSIETVKANHPFKTMFGAVEAVETPDDLIAVIKLTQPHPALELAMSSALLPIIPEHVYSKLGEGETAKNHPMNATPVGSGPFKFKEYKKGEYIILEKNEDYFLPGKPYLDRIVYKIVRDSSQRVITMERGEADFYTEVESLNIRRLQEAKNLEVTDQGGEAIGPITWLASTPRRRRSTMPRCVRRSPMRSTATSSSMPCIAACPALRPGRSRRPAPTTMTRWRPMTSIWTRRTPCWTRRASSRTATASGSRPRSTTCRPCPSSRRTSPSI